MTTLFEAIQSTRRNHAEWVLQIPDGWQQGRGAFGGLVIAAMIRAGREALGDPERRIRSVTAELLGPVLVGEATLRVERLRQGSNVSGLRVLLLQSEKPGAAEVALCQATILAGRQRPGMPSWQQVAPPTIPDWKQCDEVTIPEPFAPAFIRHFEIRPTSPLPFGGAPTATAQGFVRPRHPGDFRSSDGAEYFAACADAWWPAAFACFDAPRPMATVGYTLYLFQDTVVTDVPIFHSAVCEVLQDGYASEVRHLWSTQGELIAQNYQRLAVIR